MKTDFDWPKRITELEITSNRTIIGALEHSSQYVFSYDSKKAYPCSLIMPVRLESYSSGKVHPVFEMNLPEGFLRRYIHQRLLRYTRVNDMLFLALQHNRGIGHLGYNSTIDTGVSKPVSLSDILTAQKKDNLFGYLLDRYGLTHTLSGMQPKLLVETDKSTIAYPNCIIKTSDKEFPDLAVNEYVCMSLARLAGIPVPDHSISVGHDLFLINRFDIADGQKLGFEDFCALMGLSGEERYSRSYEAAMKVLQVYNASPADIEMFFRMLVFCCAIGNGDAHLKNFGLLYNVPQKNKVKLAPGYDFTCTIFYEHLDRGLALKLNKNFDFPNSSELAAFGKKYEIKRPEKIIDDVLTSVKEGLDSLDILSEYSKLKETIARQVAFTATKNASGVSVPTVNRTRKKKYP